MSVPSIQLGSTELELLPERAAFDRRTGTLFIADTHFGKNYAMQRSGMAVPDGVHQEDLRLLRHLLTKYDVETLVVLGDFLHSRGGRSHYLHESLLQFRRQCEGLPIKLIRGNHDRGAGDPPIELGIECFDEPYLYCGIHCYHSFNGGKVPAISGHIHPVIPLSDITGVAQRFPVFWLHTESLVLPAFSHFTGGYVIKYSGNDRVFMIANEVVREITIPPASRR